MSDELAIAGKNYVSSKKAANSTGYAQDYIGQLARSGQIDAQRVGGLWYVLPESLEAYKARSDDFKPQPPVAVPAKDLESVVSFDGKDYISANRAAKITGYNQDYVGQLARSGKVLSRQIGNRWYVDRAGLIAHKTEKDSLLAAVQRDAVGLRQQQSVASPQRSHISPHLPAPVPLEAPRPAIAASYRSPEPMLTYITENKDLLPVIQTKQDPESAMPQRIPITLKATPIARPAEAYASKKRSKFYAKTTIKAVSALTIVVVLSYGFVSLGKNARFASAIGDFTEKVQQKAQLAGAATSLDEIIALLERVLSREIVYMRTQ